MTTDWTSGYVADIGYVFGYYRELNPSWATFALLKAGFIPPKIETACELGFGQGVSVNVHAAASNVEWHGTDFNPSQAGFAKELARVSGTNAQLHDDAFAEFVQRPNLPEFDFIGLHGIWSWISDENRRVLVDFVRRKLKVGGVLYISYNTLPGWSTFAPMRQLMTQHAEILGAEGRGRVSRINDAIGFAEKLLATNPAFARANPLVADRLKALANHNRQYLAHEYFNRDWHPMHFGSMAEWLEPAKVQYACSAHLLDHIAEINLTPAQQTFLAEIPDGMFRESVRDFMVNQQFRRDYWVKGVRRISALDQGRELRNLRFVLITHRPDVQLKVTGALGEASMAEAVYNPVLDSLADHQAKSLAELESALASKGIGFNQVFQAVLALAGNGHLALVGEESVIAKAGKTTAKLNEHLMREARGGGEITYLASPVTGGGIGATRFQQLFLLALAEGKKRPSEWAAFVWKIIHAQGQGIIKDGKTLQSPEENLAELNAQANEFAEKRLAILKAVQVA
jgi:SAM-dependent methyltransferase